jgi:[ribosomal protein S5]-alanine N-acetyltransferase
LSLPQTIETARLVLRPFRRDDAEALFEYAADPDYARFQSGPEDFTRDASDNFLDELMQRDRAARPVWAVTQAERVVGIVNLNFESGDRLAVLGYGLHRELWGQGLAAEAVRAVLGTAFTAYPHLQRVRANTDARNQRSITLLTRLGFAHEGTLRRDQFSRGEWVDVAIFGLLREEWQVSPP